MATNVPGSGTEMYEPVLLLLQMETENAKDQRSGELRTPKMTSGRQ